MIPSTHRHIDTSTHRHIDTSTHRHIDTSTHRHIDTSTHTTTTSTHPNFHNYMYIIIYMHACMHTCMHAYMHTCIHAYMHTWYKLPWLLMLWCTPFINNYQSEQYFHIITVKYSHNLKYCGDNNYTPIRHLILHLQHATWNRITLFINKKI